MGVAVKQAAVSLLTMLFSALACSAALGAAQPGATPAMTGFTPSAAAEQSALEQRFDALLDPADLRDWMKRMASEPNHVGAPHNRKNAEYLRDLFREWGWQAEIETFDVLYPTLERHALEMVAPLPFTAVLSEPPVAGDASSARTDVLPTYNVYGADGDVTAELVYVNYGMPDDYDELARRGVDMKGRIAIARYGGGWRGLKPKLAQEHGAVGCLIYSDPKDDGYAVGETYPRGGWRPPEGAQRGSVADMPIYPGDPLTPGTGATRDAKRLPIPDAKTDSQDSGDAYLIRGCSAAAGRAGGTGGAGHVARRAADHLPDRARPGPGSPSDRFGVEPEDALRRDREDTRRRKSGRVGHARKSPRRLDLRRLGSAVGTRGRDGGGQGDRCAAQVRLEAAPHDRVCELGRRGGRPARLH
jgi:hypothetical protein